MDENRDILFHKGFNKEKARKIIMFIEENCFNLAWEFILLINGS